MEQESQKLRNEDQILSLIEDNQHLKNVHLLPSYSESSVVIFIGLNQDSQLTVGLAHLSYISGKYSSSALTDVEFSAKFDEFFSQKRNMREIGDFFMEQLKQLDLPNKAKEFKKSLI